MKLIPASSARWMMRVLSARSSLPQGPNIIAPRHKGLTCTPVRPRGRYSMLVSFTLFRLRGSGFGDDHGEALLAGFVRIGSVAHAGVEGVDGGELLRAELEVEDVEVFGDACRVGRFGDG